MKIKYLKQTYSESFKALKYRIWGYYRATVYIFLEYTSISSSPVAEVPCKNTARGNSTVNKKQMRKRNCGHIASLLDTIESNMLLLLVVPSIIMKLKKEVFFALFCDRSPFCQYCQYKLNLVIACIILSVEIFCK